MVAEQTRDEVETEEALARLQIMQARENRYLAELELARATAVLDQHTITSPIDEAWWSSASSRRVNIPMTARS